MSKPRENHAPCTRGAPTVYHARKSLVAYIGATAKARAISEHPMRILVAMYAARRHGIVPAPSAGIRGATNLTAGRFKMALIALVDDGAVKKSGKMWRLTSHGKWIVEDALGLPRGEWINRDN